MTFQFVADFFTTDIMNHCELLITTTELGKHDEVLLVPMLESMSSEDPVKEVNPFYEGHDNLTKNPLHLSKAYTALMSLKGHSFNIYECSLIKEGKIDWRLYTSATLTLVLQTGIFAILIIYNLEKYQQVSRDWLIWVIAACTTYFFFMRGWSEYNAAEEFNAVFRMACLDEDRATSDNLMLAFNSIANKLFSILITLFNTYFVLLSKSPNDAVLNALALTFILEVDDMAAPQWAEEEILEKLAKKMHEYIMIPLSESSEVDADLKEGLLGDLTVTRSGMGNYSSDDKLYVQLDDDDSTVIVHKRVDSCNYATTRYKIAGRLATPFVKALSEFECLHHYKGIHD